MGELVVKYLLTLPTPTSLLERIMAPGAVRNFYTVAWFLACALTGFGVWWVLVRVLFAVLRPQGRIFPAIIFFIALITGFVAAGAIGYVLMRFLP